MIPTVNDILTPVYKTLEPDATLRSASYLNGSGKVFKFSSRPANTQLPCMTMFARFARFLGQQTHFHEYIVTVLAYVAADQNFTYDIDRLSRIKQREIELLDDTGALTGQTEGLTLKNFILETGMQIVPLDTVGIEERVARTEYLAWIG